MYCCKIITVSMYFFYCLGNNNYPEWHITFMIATILFTLHDLVNETIQLVRQGKKFISIMNGSQMLVHIFLILIVLMDFGN